MKQTIKTKNAPQAIGPYNQAVSINGMVFISGQIPFDKNGILVGNDIKLQTEQCLKNIENILNEIDLNKQNIVKTTIFLNNMNDFSSVNEKYAAFFEGTIYPARSTIEVSRLPKDVKIEIEAIAIINI